ncbi:hypothetical protein CEXT_749591 [Caerostris extrusa]|uniref:Uncharacterized protein n=1 Tax=Caerostris extrusa TaxID=172846 RepID=A0AAV4T606_CAEEX|nr:hypothetical protein CEXT_749591 [Caerostris extrusa]
MNHLSQRGPRHNCTMRSSECCMRAPAACYFMDFHIVRAVPQSTIQNTAGLHQRIRRSLFRAGFARGCLLPNKHEVLTWWNSKGFLQRQQSAKIFLKRLCSFVGEISPLGGGWEGGDVQRTTPSFITRKANHNNRLHNHSIGIEPGALHVQRTNKPSVGTGPSHLQGVRREPLSALLSYKAIKTVEGSGYSIEVCNLTDPAPGRDIVGVEDSFQGTHKMDAGAKREGEGRYAECCCCFETSAQLWTVAMGNFYGSLIVGNAGVSMR